MNFQAEKKSLKYITSNTSLAVSGIWRRAINILYVHSLQPPVGKAVIRKHFPCVIKPKTKIKMWHFQILKAKIKILFIVYTDLSAK